MNIFPYSLHFLMFLSLTLPLLTHAQVNNQTLPSDEIFLEPIIPSTGSPPFPLFSPPPNHKFSGVWCRGGRGRLNSYGDRSCRFQNLCYLKSNNEWIYYSDPLDEYDPTIIMDNGEIQPGFPDKLVNLRSMGIERDARYWSPKLKKGPIPPDTQFVKTKNGKPFIGLLFHPHYPANIGHVIGDDLFPAFNLMALFGMLTSEIQLILQRDCNQIFPSSQRKASQCVEMLNMLTPGITQKQWLAATQNDFYERLGIDLPTDLVCFENLLAGQGPFGFQQSLGKSPSWWAYHAYYLNNMGLSSTKTPKKQKITVSIKRGKRGIHNNDEMVAYLRSAFPDIEIDAIELRSLNGWRNELEYLQNTSVLITPCGGVSMSAMFLPHNAALIVVDYYNTKAQSSVGMEEKLWANLGYIRAFHYPFTENEVQLDEKLFSRQKYQDMRDYGQVKVDLKRMEIIVQAALGHTNQFMKFGIE